MKKYLIRLDDACERMDISKWNRIETLFDKYNVKPLVGIIPCCEDSSMSVYEFDNSFWELVHNWIDKGWIMALHGYNHVYSTNCGGINPVNKRSEFAGESIDVQKSKIRNGLTILSNHGVFPEVFFAPSHTFDNNTLLALEQESTIRIISDTIAWDIYKSSNFVFVPQQSGKARKLPFRTTTFCYHPNTMQDNDFLKLEHFLKKKKISEFSVADFRQINRKKGLIDVVVSNLYFLLKKMKKHN